MGAYRALHPTPLFTGRVATKAKQCQPYVMKTWITYISLALCLLASKANATEVVFCILDSQRKLIQDQKVLTVRIDDNWIETDGYWGSDKLKIVGKDRGVIVAQRVFPHNSSTIMRVFTYDSINLRFNKKDWWLMVRFADGGSMFEKDVTDLSYRCGTP